MRQRNAVRQLIPKFEETGSVCDATRSGRPSIRTKKKEWYQAERIITKSSDTYRFIIEKRRDVFTYFAHCMLVYIN